MQTGQTLEVVFRSIQGLSIRIGVVISSDNRGFDLRRDLRSARVRRPQNPLRKQNKLTRKSRQDAVRHNATVWTIPTSRTGCKKFPSQFLSDQQPILGIANE